ncbi:hypothetical protein J6590_106151, partial [Homalodisca vitripennis]
TFHLSTTQVHYMNAKCSTTRHLTHPPGAYTVLNKFSIIRENVPEATSLNNKGPVKIVDR